MSEILLIKLFFSVRDKLPKISFEYKCILSKGRFKWNYLTLKSDLTDLERNCFANDICLPSVLCMLKTIGKSFLLNNRFIVHKFLIPMLNVG